MGANGSQIIVLAWNSERWAGYVEGRGEEDVRPEERGAAVQRQHGGAEAGLQAILATPIFRGAERHCHRPDVQPGHIDSGDPAILCIYCIVICLVYCHLSLIAYFWGEHLLKGFVDGHPRLCRLIFSGSCFMHVCVFKCRDGSTCC